MEGVVSMDIVVGGQRLAVEFVVVSTRSVQSLLGIDFLKRYACVIDVPNTVMQCWVKDPIRDCRKWGARRFGVSGQGHFDGECNCSSLERS